DDFPFIRIFLIGFRYLRTVISVIGPDPLELVRTKFSNQRIPIFYQIINRPPPAISFLNNKTINYNKKNSETKNNPIVYLHLFYAYLRVCASSPNQLKLYHATYCYYVPIDANGVHEIGRASCRE